SAALDFLLNNLHRFPDLVKRNAVYTLSNLCRGKPSPNWTTISQVVQPLTDLLEKITDHETIIDILWALAFVSEDRDEGYNMFGEPNIVPDDWPESFQINAVIKTGVVRPVIKFIKQATTWREEIKEEMDEVLLKGMPDYAALQSIVPLELQQKQAISDRLMAPCVRIMGNIVSGTDEQTAVVVKAGFFAVIEKCVDYPVVVISKEACWALSNVIASADRNNLDMFFEQKSLVKKLVDLCLTEKANINLRKEACWCLGNALTLATFEQLTVLINLGFIEAMVKLLNTKLENSSCGKMEELGGLNLLEDILAMESISEHCHALLSTFLSKNWPMDNFGNDGPEDEEEEEEEEEEEDDDIYGNNSDEHDPGYEMDATLEHLNQIFSNFSYE
ncbi:hypothetical protein RFI_14896, partial [Reticulomyxa filosa]